MESERQWPPDSKLWSDALSPAPEPVWSIGRNGRIRVTLPQPGSYKITAWYDGPPGWAMAQCGDGFIGAAAGRFATWQRTFAMLHRLAPERRYNLIVGSAIALLLLVILLHIAITADAYVTFRVVDNFVHGYGLRWNVGEPVCGVYTHPLWMLLAYPVFMRWGINIFYVTVALSATIYTLVAMLLAVHTFRKPWPQTAGPVHYAALGIAELYLFLHEWLWKTRWTHLSIRLFRLGIGQAAGQSISGSWASASYCALSLLNRLDTISFICARLFAIWLRRGFALSASGKCLLGALPLIGW